MKRYIQINWHGLLYFNICILFHLISFSIFFIASRHHPAIMGAGVIAYLLGLRHAFDADHIAAIDNTVRKLVEQKQDSTGVGFFFSLGHSTVVIIMSLVLSWFVHWSRYQFAFVSHIGGIFGSLVSGLFLLLIAVINCVTLYKLFNTYNKRRRSAQEADEDGLAEPYGFLTHLFKRLFHLVNRSCHMYPIGFLFGLGFDTTTEVAVLALSAELTKGFVPFSAILSIPLLFTSGMIIIDTIDSVMMSKAYKFALLNPIRRMIYNIIVTCLSVLAAFFIGIIELGQTFSNLFQWKGAFWHFIGMMNLSSIGYLLFSLLLAAWLVAFVLWQRKDTALLKQ